MFKHKYIRRYNTDEDYQESLANRELEEAAVSAIIGDREDIPDTYQYSIRETNNDDKVLGHFNKEDGIKYFGGLEIIWGYWGWVWNDIEFEGKTLHGGHFDNIKNTTEYPMIEDGYRLEHIDNLTLGTSKVSEVGYFDASNIVSAKKAFYKSSPWSYINTYDWPKLKCADSMFDVISKQYLRGHDLNMPELVTLNAPMARVTRFDDDEPVHINLGKLEKLYLNDGLYYNSTYCNNGNSYAVRFPINTMFVGLDNCHTFVINNTYDGYTAGNRIWPRANVDIEVTYEGDEIVIAPELSSHSKFKLSVPGKFGSSGYASTITQDVLVTSDGYTYGNYLIQDSRRYVNCLEKGLDVDYDMLTINNPNGYFAGFYFKDDDELPFYSKRHTAIMYSYCRFDNMEIEFDCADGGYNYNDGYGVKSTYTEFYNCQFNNVSLTMKDILQHGRISLNFSTVTNSTLDIGFSEHTQISNKYIELGKVISLVDIDGIEFINCHVVAKVNISNSVIKVTKDYGNFSWNIEGNLSNVTIKDGMGLYGSHNSYSLNGNFENCAFSALGNNLSLYTTNGDYSDVIITNINDQTSIFLSNAVKTPILKGHRPYNTIIKGDKLEEIYAEELQCYMYEISDSTEGYYTLDLNSNTVLRILNLGKYWRTLKVGHAKLLDKDTLYASIQRRGITPTGELWLHRNVWEQYTQEEQDYINSQFNFVNVIIDETENEDEQIEQES